MAQKNVKVVRVKESDMVKMLEGIVAEAVAEKKKEWISEMQQKQASVIEEQVDKILKDRLSKVVIRKKK
jgi:galactose-1-phosphate uridylyltransferase